MSRPPSGYYFRDGYYTEVGGRRRLLVRGPKGKHTKAIAQLELAKLLLECEANPSVESGVHTVASIIDEYLVFAQKHVAASTFYEQKLYLQAFCDDHGARRIPECIPYHLTKWVDSHPKWESAWTRAYAIRSLYTFDFKVKFGAEKESSWSPKSGRPRVSICRGLLDHLRWQMRVPLNGTNGLR